jgi:3-methyladenine DNA glycosylase AlkC
MPEAFKDMFFKRIFFDDLAAAIASLCPAFDTAAFVERIYDDQWEERELKGRLRHSTRVLHDLLPPDYRVALGLLRQIAPTMHHHDFARMIFSDFVEVYGLADWEASLPALEQFTQQISAEFAVRPFIAQDPAKMMAQMLAWAQHENPDVRRLASEGCRPRLPWGMALTGLQADPLPILPVLEHLKDDPSESVRLSASNNLNDISKDHPDLVIEIARRWLAGGTPEIRTIVNHALRTLVKRGNTEALELLGYAGGDAFAVKNLQIGLDVVPIGGQAVFSFDVESLSDAPQKLMIDYVVHHVRANGELTPKVFKLTKRELEPGATITITKRHSFAPVTTRRYYPGRHALEVQVNGARCGRCEFDLVPADSTARGG